jgi:predicted DCC family thiol-disulfide oxidoreductase YuxK
MTDAPVLLFDGVCNLCDAAVRFVIERDPPPATFRFAALQSETGRALLGRFGLPVDALDTVVLLDGERAFTRSSAGLRVLARLGLPWSLLAVLLVVPRPLRDAAYDWIARNRYRWFGRRETCLVPTPEVRSRFLP